MKNKFPMIVGAAVFATVQVLWSVAHAAGAVRGAWVMKTGLGIGLCFGAFVIAATFVSALQPRGSGLANSILGVVGGGLLALCVALALVGPGNLWPIVIVFNGVIIGVATLVGAAVGAGFRKEGGTT